RGITSDVPRKGVHVANEDALLLLRRRPAHSPADCDANTRWLALEWSEHELLAAEQVEAAPIDPLQRAGEKRRRVGQVRDRIGFPFKQCVKLANERAVTFGLIGSTVGSVSTHGATVTHRTKDPPRGRAAREWRSRSIGASGLLDGDGVRSRRGNFLRGQAPSRSLDGGDGVVLGPDDQQRPDLQRLLALGEAIPLAEI